MKLTNLVKLGYTPRWVILSIDVFLSLLSIILAFLLRYNFRTEAIINDLFVRGIVITVALYLASFIATKSYKEIIRHTTFRSVLKIFSAIITANAILVLLNFFFYAYDQILVIPYSVLCINIFISFFMLGGSRVFIKQIFDTAIRINSEPVIIFGAGNIGQAALKTILLDKIAKWKVVALVDEDPAKAGKSLAGVSIYSLDQVDKLLKKHTVKKVIIAADNISLDRRNEVASIFIKHGLQVSLLPSIKEFPEGPFSLRRLKDIKIEDLLERDPIKTNNIQINATLKGKRILVTGAAGSIGSEIVRQIALFNPEIIMLCDVAESPLHAIGLEMEENFKGIPYKLFIANISDAVRMDFIFSNFAPNVVFHAAAYKHVPMMEEHPREAVLNNIGGTKILADLSVQYGVARFVMVSTDKAVNPTNVMGASKRIAEMYIQGLSGEESSVNAKFNGRQRTLFITTRFGNVLASNGSVIPLFKTQLEKGGPITVTHPDITRFFMTIPEACQLVLEAGVMGKGGEIFVFDMGKSIRIADLAKNMIVLAGLKPEEDIKIHYTGLRPGEKLFEEVLSNSETTLPTYHPKIKIARVQQTSFAYINNAISNLSIAARKGYDWECVKTMKEILPEFISNNSRFENLDQNNRDVSRGRTLTILNGIEEEDSFENVIL